MRLVLTGADQSLGASLCRGLTAAGDTVLPVGDAETPPHDLGAAEPYRRLDLGQPDVVSPVVAGADAIVHARPHDPSGAGGVLLEASGRGTYVLAQAAREAGVGRLVIVSQLALFEDYPEDYLVEASWKPRPRPEARSLAPWLAELVGREIARARDIDVTALRMGALGAPEGTSAEDAVAAVTQALTGDAGDRGRRRRGDYRWHERHVASGGRFAAGE